MWSLFTQGALAALVQVAAGDVAPPPSAPIACTPAEQRLASSLRRARLERTLEEPMLAAEIASLGLAILRPCLDSLERERVAQVVPGDGEQQLSRPQRDVVLRVLARLPQAEVLRATYERVELGHEEPARRLVLDVLGAVGGVEHLPRLLEAGSLDGESAPPRAVEAAFQSALAGILAREPRAYERLASYHRDAPEVLGDAIVCAVGDAGDPRGLAFLEHLITFRPEALSLCASQVRRLGRSGDAAVDRGLAQRLRWAVDPDRPEACRALLLALGELHDYESMPLLIELLEHDDAGLSGNALWALRRITGLDLPALPARWRAWYEGELAWFQRQEEFALRDLHIGSASVAAAAARAIGERRLWREELAQELLAALARPQPALRAPICRALERLGVDSVAPNLVELLEDDDPGSAQAAWHALVALTGRELPADATTWRLALASDS